MYHQKSQQHYPPLDNVAGAFSWVQERPRAEAHRSDSQVAATSACVAVGSTLVTAAACLIPWIALTLGISGLGFLTRYTYLQVPASIATVVLLVVSYRALRRARATCGGKAMPRLATALFRTAVVFAVAINVTEYLVLPALG